MSHRRPGRWELVALAGVLILAGGVMLRPVLMAPATMALGSPMSEAPRHLWGLWGAALNLDTFWGLVSHLDLDHPDGYTRHLMDPVNLLFFLPGFWLAGGGPAGAALGYNLVHLAWPVIGGAGTWLLVRRLLSADDHAGPVALLAALAAATAPYLLATPWLGRTELLPAMAWPLHLWLLHRALSPSGRRRDVAGAGLTLAAMALGGWYLAAWLCLLEPPVALAMAVMLRGARPWPRQAWRVAVVAALAVIPVLPALWAVLAYPPPVMAEDHTSQLLLGVNTPPWMLLPFTSLHGLPGVDLPAYPGAVVAALATWGAIRRPAARPWFLLALWVLVLSLGRYLVLEEGSIEGHPLRLPAWWLEWLLPPLRFIWGWCRIGILATPLLAVAAAFGVQDILGRMRETRIQIMAILAALVLVDHTRHRAPASVMGDSFQVAPPAALTEALADLPDGALLQLPMDDFYMVWQPALGRPVAESLEIEAVRSRSYIVQEFNRFLGPGPGGLEPAAMRRQLYERLSGEDLRGCLLADRATLADLGFSVVALHRGRLPEVGRYMLGFLLEALGPPAREEGDLTLWVIAPEAAHGPPCPVEPVSRHTGRLPQGEAGPAGPR